MGKDQTLGWAILIGSVGGVAVYFYLTFLSPWAMLTIKLTVFVALAAVLFIVAWIGYTMATTPPPAPLEDFDFGEDVSGDDEVESPEHDE